MFSSVSFHSRKKCVYWTESWKLELYPAGIHLFKDYNKNNRTRGEICSKLTIKTLERRHWSLSGVFIVNFENISHLALVFLLLTLDMQLPPFCCFSWIYHGFKGCHIYSVSEGNSESCQKFKMELKSVTYFLKKFHFKCLTGLWMHLWIKIEKNFIVSSPSELLSFREVFEILSNWQQLRYLIRFILKLKLKKFTTVTLKQGVRFSFLI